MVFVFYPAACILSLVLGSIVNREHNGLIGVRSGGCELNVAILPYLLVELRKAGPPRVRVCCQHFERKFRHYFPTKV
jgi:hypothetical protein